MTSNITRHNKVTSHIIPSWTEGINMKFHSTIVALVLFLASYSLCVAAEDWRVTLYDNAVALFVAFDQKEADILTRLEPKLAEFYSIYLPYEDARRKLSRRAFLKQLEQNPKTINWSNTWEWFGGRGVGTEEYEKLASEDPVYRELRDSFSAKKEALRKAKDLTWMRNKAYEKHAEIFHELEENLLKDLKTLQDEVDQRMSNTPLEPPH